MTTDVPPTLGPRARGRTRAAHGRRRQGADPRSAARPSSTACSRRSRPQCTRHHPQCQRRSGALCRYRAAGRARQRAGFRRARSPAFSPGSTGRRRKRRRSNGWSACRATARSCRDDLVSTAACGARSARASRSPARARATGGIRSSALWPVALARGSAPRADRRGPAQDRGVDRAPRRRASPTGRPSRSIRSSTSIRRRTSPGRAYCSAACGA